MENLPETFWAWLAGFVEADGCLGVYMAQGHSVEVLTASQKDRVPLDFIKDRVGGSICRTHAYKGKYIWRWSVGSKRAREITERMLPYMVTKRDRAQDVLTHKLSRTNWSRKNASSRNPKYAEVLRRYKAGESAQALSKETGVKDQTILYWARMEGVARTLKDAQQLRRRRESAEPKRTLERADGATTRPEAARAEKLYLKQVPISEIARRLGKKPATVNYWLRKRGVTRSNSEAQKLRRKAKR